MKSPINAVELYSLVAMMLVGPLTFWIIHLILMKPSVMAASWLLFATMSFGVLLAAFYVIFFGLPYYLLLKLLNLNHPVVVGVSGAPMIWVLSEAGVVDLGPREITLTMICAAVSSLTFGILIGIQKWAPKACKGKTYET